MHGWHSPQMSMKNRKSRLINGSALHLVQTLGELKLEEHQYAALFIWGGCCMHKEMNSVKGGNVWMMAFWAKNNLPGLKMLFNKDGQQLDLAAVLLRNEPLKSPQLEVSN